MEIESPGLLLPGLTVVDLRRGVSKLRNRVIGRVFQELGLIGQWGSRIQRMSAACLGAGLPAPLLEEIGTRFRVTLHTARGQAPRLDGIDQAILDSLSGSMGRSTNEIAAEIERTPRATRTRLASLVERGARPEAALLQGNAGLRRLAAHAGNAAHLHALSSVNLALHTTEGEDKP